MNKFLIIAVTILLTITELASAQQDSSLYRPYLVDSIQQALPVNTFLNKLDSVTTACNRSIDSLRENIPNTDVYLKEVHKQYDKLSQRLSRLDSLSHSASKEVHKIDSLLSQKKIKIDSILGSSHFMKVESKLNFPGLSEKIPDAELSALSDKLSIPDLKINNRFSDYSLPTSIGMNGKLPQNNFEETSERFLKNLEGAKEIERSHMKIESLTKQGEEYSKALQDAEALKLKAKEEFIDHFEGKEEIIKKDFEDIAKLQTKYRDIADSRLLPKHKWKMNAMKGKPFIERVVPGIDLQIFTSSNISINAAPTISYKISGTFQTGIGAFKRLTYFKKEGSLRLVDSYGLRFFSQTKVFKGINVFGEFERYKPDGDSRMIIQSSATQFDDTRLITRLNLGLMNTYSVGKNIRGFFVVLYDVLQLKKFPNTAGSSARFGFQYQLKTKKK